MKYLKTYESFERTRKALNGEISNWDEMSSDEKSEYLYADEGRLEIEYKKVISKGITEEYGYNGKFWTIVYLLINKITEIDKNISNKLKYLIAEHKNPIYLLQEELPNFDINQITEGDKWFKGKIYELIELKNLNPFIDPIWDN